MTARPTVDFFCTQCDFVMLDWSTPKDLNVYLILRVYIYSEREYATVLLRKTITVEIECTILGRVHQKTVQLQQSCVASLSVISCVKILGKIIQLMSGKRVLDTKYDTPKLGYLQEIRCTPRRCVKPRTHKHAPIAESTHTSRDAISHHQRESCGRLSTLSSVQY